MRVQVSLVTGVLVVAVLAAIGLRLGPFAPAPAPDYFSAAFVKGAEFEFDPPAPGSYGLPAIKSAPDGEVLDIHGETRSLAEITEGKISLVSFVYLMCGDVNGCPLAISTLYNIYDGSLNVPELRGEVQLLTVSFDPARDTVEAIEAFHYPVTSDPDAERKIEWDVLTTSGPEALQPILDGYGQTIDLSNNQELISHLLRIYLVDRKGVIRNVYGLGLIDPRLLMTDVETLMMEEGRR
ncbi:MAG: SCO family protein [Maritimibacter sp.]|nr:SCO family protein [Maritimibacter sp.]